MTRLPAIRDKDRTRAERERAVWGTNVDRSAIQDIANTHDAATAYFTIKYWTKPFNAPQSTESSDSATRAFDDAGYVELRILSSDHQRVFLISRPAFGARSGLGRQAAVSYFIIFVDRPDLAAIAVEKLHCAQEIARTFAICGASVIVADESGREIALSDPTAATADQLMDEAEPVEAPQSLWWS